MHRINRHRLSWPHRTAPFARQILQIWKRALAFNKLKFITAMRKLIWGEHCDGNVQGSAVISLMGIFSKFNLPIAPLAVITKDMRELEAS